MSDPQIRERMRAAEVRVRAALKSSSSGDRFECLMREFRIAEGADKDALFAALAARLTLSASSPSQGDAA